MSSSCEFFAVCTTCRSYPNGNTGHITAQSQPINTTNAAQAVSSFPSEGDNVKQVVEDEGNASTSVTEDEDDEAGLDNNQDLLGMNDRQVRKALATEVSMTFTQNRLR